MNFNIELDCHTNKNGERLVMIRCTKDRKHKRISTGIYIEPKFWDKVTKLVRKKHPLAEEYNAAITQKRLEITQMYLKLLREVEDLSLDAFIRKLNHPVSMNFFQFALDYKLSQFVTNKKLGTYRRYEAVLSKLKAFAGEQLNLNQITYTLIKDFENHLLTVKGNGRDTVSANLSVIRSIIYEAIRHDLFTKKNPFDSIRLTYTDNTKMKLTIPELKALYEVKLPDIHSLILAKDFFIACFYAGGCRAGDMVKLKWLNITCDKLCYIQQKTGKKMELPILPELAEIFERYKSKSPYIFPLLHETDDVNELLINSKVTFINKYLKEVCKYAGIFKKVSTHCARHTFSDISLSLNNNDIYGLQSVLGHSSVKITEGYLTNRNYSKNGEFLRSISSLLT